MNPVGRLLTKFNPAPHGCAWIYKGRQTDTDSQSKLDIWEESADVTAVLWNN